MSIVAIQLNDQPLNLPDVTTTPGENVLKLAYDRKNWPRVTINNQNVNSVDGKTWKITLPVGLSTLRIQHWNDATQVNDTDKTFKIVANRPPEQSKMQWGFVANFEDNEDFVIETCAKLGVKFVRLWISPMADITTRQVAVLRKYKNAGIKIILTVQPSGNWYLNKTDVGGWAKRNAIVINSNVDILGAGNEFNFGDYRPEDLGGADWHQAYVDKYLKPIKAAVTAPVASVPIAYNANPGLYEIDYQKLRAAGAFQVADYCDVHPYSSPANVDAVGEQMAKAKAISGLPMISTEFNIVTATPDADWVTAYPKHVANAKKNLTIACYYRCVKIRDNQKALISSSGNKLDFYYDTFKAAM